MEEKDKKNYQWMGSRLLQEMITGNKSEKSTSFSTEKLQLLLSSVDNPIWSTDNAGLLTAYNKCFENYFTTFFHEGPKEGINILEIFKRDNYTDWFNLYEKALNGEKVKAETKLEFGNNYHYFEIVASPLAEKNKVSGCVFIAHDITDRKTTISILNRAKAQLKALINNIPSLVWLKDASGNFTIVNQTFINFFNLDKGTIRLSALSVPPELDEFFKFISNDSEILNSGAKLMEERNFLIKKESRWFEIHKTPIYNEKLELVGTTGLARDITNRKTIENILLESEEKFRQFAENTTDAFILCAKENVLYVNPAFEKIYGRNVIEAYENRHIPLDWVFPDDKKLIESIWTEKSYTETGKFNLEFRIVKPDGSIAWIWERTFPVYNPSGDIIRYITVASDITRQKQLEQELITIQTQQQAILDNIPHLAWLKSTDGKYVSVNESFAKFYNHPKIDLLGKTDSDICHPDLAELYAYNDYLVIKTKKQQQFDEFVDTKDGTVYTETTKTPIINSEGEVIGITGISRDITYYKRIEQQLRANDDKIKALLKNSTDAITVIDTAGFILFDTSFISKVAENKASEIHNKFFLDFVSANDKELVNNAIQQVITNPESQKKVEFRCVDENDSILYFESFLSNHLENNLIHGIVINSRNITERKIAELKEKEYQENLIFLENTALEFLSISSSEQIYNYIGTKIHELVPESVVIFTSCNDEDDTLIIQNVTGIDKFMGIVIDFLGQSPVQYHTKLTSQMRRELMASSNKLHSLRGGIYNICNRQLDFMICKALEKLISLNKVYGMGLVRSGKLLGSIVIITRYEHDVKDPRIIETFLYQASIALLRRKLEKELIVSKERAEESDKLKTAFLANMSHEIRTPVNGIIGFSQLLENENVDNEKRKEFIEVIRSNANSLISLIDDIIDVSRIQEGQVKIRKSTININLLLDEVYSGFLAPQYSEKGIVLDVKKSLSDEEAILIIDSMRLKQILNNLISNAFKFTEEGSIQFGYVEDGDFVRFFVKDTGIGIQKDKQDAIFQRFTQGDVSFTRRFGGSGLGLAISKGLVELMGGKIWVESEPNQGATFNFTLPSCTNSKKKTTDQLLETAKNNPTLLN